MRWLFLFVLFLNLAYVGWQQSQAPIDTYADIAPLRDVTPIVLLSELPPELLAAAEGVTAVKIETDEQVVTKVSVEELQGEVEPLAVKQAVVVEKVMSVEAEKVPEVAQEVELPNDSSKQCFTVGPFRDLDTLSGLTQDIKPYVATTSFRSQDESAPTVYWVYIKPEKTRTKAIEVGKRLKAKKIKDFYVIRDGVNINGLSLGHFRNKDGAYGLTKKVKNLGFRVQVEPVHKKYTLYWLDYQLVEGKKIPAPLVDKYTKATKDETISRLTRDCEA